LNPINELKQSQQELDDSIEKLKKKLQEWQEVNQIDN